MNVDTAVSKDYEQTLIQIVRNLPRNRVEQLIDFAHFLEYRAVEEGYGEEDQEIETEEEIRASEEKWDKLFAKPEAQRAMREMAREALEDYHAGETTNITVTENGRLAPE